MGGSRSPVVGTNIGPAVPAGPEGIRFVFALHYQSTGGIAGMARPTAWPADVEHPDRKRRERLSRSGTLWVSPPRGAGNRFIAAFFPVSGIRELSGVGLNEVGPSARPSCAWPITPRSFSTISDSTTPSGVAIGESAHFGLELFLFSGRSSLAIKLGRLSSHSITVEKASLPHRLLETSLSVYRINGSTWLASASLMRKW